MSDTPKKKGRECTPLPDRDEFVKKRQVEGLTRTKLAEHYGVTESVIRRWIRVLDVPRRPHGTASRRKKIKPKMRAIDTSDQFLTTTDKALDILDARVIERKGFGYYLDGRPASIDQILVAAQVAPEPIL